MRFVPWARALEMGSRGEVPGILSCARNADREKYFLLSEPISYAEFGFAALASREVKKINHLSDADKYKVGSIIGYTSSTELTDAGIEHDLSPTDRVALKKLEAGRIELLYSELNTTRYLVKTELEGVNLKYFLMGKRAYHLCISKQWPDAQSLLSMFNAGLAEIQADGTFDSIQRKYQ